MVQLEQIFPSLTWRIRHEAMYADQPFDVVKLANDFDGVHFGLYADHKLTGVVSVFAEGDVYQFRKLAVLPQAQKMGYGSQLVEYMIDFCKIQKASKVWCNARVNAKEFYFKFGFQETNKTFSKNGYDFVIMELILNNN
ncbi:N-acetyltransferase [Pedobacter yonginense]|uniref:N-acetyltransferase n=1 Tax=Pedobacter yonginense TaxID=651869 RepID=A0A317EKR4_9SPHI|nr:GNAT family N-acetyltransferase [Pedobacter yonginense]PWS26965.1 N-acetyltransferase [Pedobacter yonginense]